MLHANFHSYNNYVTDNLYQWDINQDLVIEGLNLSVAPEIHFSNARIGKAIVKQSTLEGGIITVRIPNSLLQESLTIKAYIGIYEGESFKVIESIEIPIIARERPDDYSFTNDEGEIYSFKALENKIDNVIQGNEKVIESVDSLIKKSVTPITETIYDANISGKNLKVNDSVNFDESRYDYYVATISNMLYEKIDVELRAITPKTQNEKLIGLRETINGSKDVRFYVEIQDDNNNNKTLLVANMTSDTTTLECELIKLVGVTKEPSNYITIDNSYNPESENAQSGKAVAEAVNMHSAIFPFENKIKNGNFEDSTNFSPLNSTIEIANNELIATGTGVNVAFGVNYNAGISVNAGDIWYFQVALGGDKGTTLSDVVRVRVNTISGLKVAFDHQHKTPDSDYQDYFGNITFDNAQNNITSVQIVNTKRTAPDTNGAILKIKNFLALNLTELYGSGNEPSAEDVYTLLSGFENRWFDGTVDIFGKNAMSKRILDEASEIVENDIEVTVGENGDFSTINKALAYLSKYYPSYKSGGVNISIKILSGTTIKEQVFVSKIDLQHITITAEDEFVPVNCDGWVTTADAHDSRGDKPFFACENAGKFPTIACVFKLVTNTDNIQTCGLLANRGSEAVVLASSGFDSFYDCVISNNESTVTIREGIARNATRWGVHSRHNGEISARSVDATGCGISAYADRVADLDVREAILDGSIVAIDCQHTSRINANGVHANNCGSDSDSIVKSSYGSVVDCANAEITNGKGDIFKVLVGGTIISNGTNTTGLAEGKNLYNTTVNVVTANGIIYG